MTWEKFENHYGRGNNYPAMRMFKSGRYSVFYLNAAFRAEIIRQNIKKIFLFYNKELSQIGIKPAEDNSLGTHKLSAWPNRKRGMILTCNKFIRYFNIPIITKKNFPATWNEEEQMFIIQLGEKIL